MNILFVSLHRCQCLYPLEEFLHHFIDERKHGIQIGKAIQAFLRKYSASINYSDQLSTIDLEKILVNTEFKIIVSLTS